MYLKRAVELQLYRGGTMIEQVDLKKDLEIIEQLPKERQKQLQELLYFITLLEWLDDNKM